MHLVEMHLVEMHLVEMHLVEMHLVEMHLVEMHLVEMHLVEMNLLGMEPRLGSRTSRKDASSRSRLKVGDRKRSKPRRVTVTKRCKRLANQRLQTVFAEVIHRQQT